MPDDTEDFAALAEALESIEQWAEAYPLDVFPEPDLKRAADVLQAAGITLDSISAYCMRHALEGVGKIAHDALAAHREAISHETVPKECDNDGLDR